MTDLEEIILDCIHYTSTDLCKYEGIGWGKQNILRIKELLEELKDYRDKNKMVVRVDVENIESISEKIEELSEYAECQYNKAIDDFVKFANTMPTIKEKDGTIRPMWLEEMAEQLKKGERE